MLFAYLVGVCINVSQEMGGNPRIDEMGIAQDLSLIHILQNFITSFAVCAPYSQGKSHDKSDDGRRKHQC